ncbi:MAG: aldehyde dehydrogenase family protein [Parvularculaceae bacterium]
MKIPVRNPRTGENDYVIEAADASEVGQVAARLRTAQPAWFAAGIEKRAEALIAWSDSILKHKEELTDALSVDTGRYALSKSEVEGAARNLKRWASIAPGLLQSDEKSSELIQTITYANQYVPYQLAGFISPWNFPVTLSLIDAAPALIAGCAALIKPSEVTPRFVRPLLKTIIETPEISEVVDIVLGDGATGAALVNEADIICFTGSVPTGRKVAAAAAARFIPASLELGGKDPVIVLQDADIERATDAVLRGSVLNTGHACLSIERIYVDEKIYDEFVDLLTKKAAAVDLNYPDIHDGVIGPVIFERQADTIAAHIEDAVRKGAKVRCGGEVENHGGGKWLRPTVLTNVNHDMAVMVEETFGPVLPVMSYATVAEAVELANDTSFGLSAAVIGGDVAEARKVAERINAGGLSINDCGLTIATYEPEKTSFNFSGLGGSRMGPGSIYRFVRKKALIMQHGAPRPVADFAEPVAVRG